MRTDSAGAVRTGRTVCSSVQPLFIRNRACILCDESANLPGTEEELLSFLVRTGEVYVRPQILQLPVEIFIPPEDILETTFKLFAGTDVGLRENNEDNFTVCSNLTQGNWIIPIEQEKALSLDSKGCVMVVADGMGGQNAGEIASAIAINTVQEMFEDKNLTSEVTSTSENIMDYLKKTIVRADSQIKKYGASHDEAEGMGSTIVIAWLHDNIAYIAWLGDSRAYSYVPKKGIKRLSKDHSLVQKLVDEGVLTDQEAMDHPDSNIVTRSLGDTYQKAKPEVSSHIVEKGEIILLCSDGLCGVCSDEQIKDIIEHNQHDLANCKKELTEAALTAGGSDNITIALLCIEDTDNKATPTEGERQKNNRLINITSLLFGLLILATLCFAGYKLLVSEAPQKDVIETEISSDSIMTDEQQQQEVEPKEKKTVKTLQDEQPSGKKSDREEEDNNEFNPARLINMDSLGDNSDNLTEIPKGRDISPTLVDDNSEKNSK